MQRVIELSTWFKSSIFLTIQARGVLEQLTVILPVLQFSPASVSHLESYLQRWRTERSPIFFDIAAADLCRCPFLLSAAQ